MFRVRHLLRIRTREEKKEEVCCLPRLQGGFDASLQLARTKKPCGCLRTSEDKKMRQNDGDKGFEGEGEKYPVCSMAVDEVHFRDALT